MRVILCSCDVVPQVKTDAPDAEPNLKTTSALSTYGRDEKYITNKLHLLGASSVILYGVGDGMIPYCCLTLRIPCLLIYAKSPGGAVHQKTIEKFLVGKVQALMEAAAPGTRWYRTDTQLCCQEEKKKKVAKTDAVLVGKKDATLMAEKETKNKKDATLMVEKETKNKKDEKPKEKRTRSKSAKSEEKESSSGSSSSSKSAKSKKSKKE